MKTFGQLSIAALTISALYLYAWPAPNLFYAAAVLFHVGLGAVFCVAGLILLPRVLRGPVIVKLGALILAVGSVLGLALIYTGTSHSHWNLMYAHIAVSTIAVLLLAAWFWSRRRAPAHNPRGSVATVLAVAVILSVGAVYARGSWSKRFAIKNPARAVLSMDEEGDGAQGPFFPSSAQVAGHRKIPSKYFMESDACERCHQDIYHQWQGSMHHFSSFNNQWYRKSIEYMQEVDGTRPSKWCAGCHDPALLYSGMMDTPIKQILDRPETQAGLGCMMCHSITKVKSTMGQGDFVLDYPELHELAASKNPVVRWLHDFS